jgi:hypothetical protein
VPYTPLNIGALSDLCCILQSTFRMKLIAKLKHFYHEALK